MRRVFFIIIGLGLIAEAAPALAQTGCYTYPAGSSKRIRCLNLEAEAARNYARDRDEITRDLDRTHRRIGRDLRTIGTVLPPAKPMAHAWNGPRYADDARRKVNEWRERRRSRRNR